MSSVLSVLNDLTATQRDAVTHEGGPLLIIAGAGTGKTTVIARRIAWLIASQRATPDHILALTFTDKAAKEMEERVDLLVPYGYLDIPIRTFHAFGDQFLREHATKLGLSPHFRVLSAAEQLVFLRQRVFELPLTSLRPLHDPVRFLDALLSVFARAKDEAVDPEEYLAYAKTQEEPRTREVAECYAAYERLLRKADAVDFGDQVLLIIRLLEEHPEILAGLKKRFRYILVDEFQDTNYAQYRLLRLLAEPTANVTVVGDDDQSIYKWRGAAISNVLKFLDDYTGVRTVVLTENFRSTQAILDCAYRLIRFNDPDRLETKRAIEKRLVARAGLVGDPPHLRIFDTVSSEADWVAATIRQMVEAGARRPSDVAILVRSNREAEVFLRALNVAGVPWHFSGTSGLFAREEAKMLLSCLKTLADPDDSLSWYHVASSPLYACSMTDLSTVLAHSRKTHRSMRSVLERFEEEPALTEMVSEAGKQQLLRLREDVLRLVELSRTFSSGQVLYQWLSERGWLTRLSREERLEDALQLQTVAQFFNQLQRMEGLIGGQLPELMQHLELFQALGNEAFAEDDAWADRVKVLTLHKAKGLEFSVVFMVGLVQGRFPTPKRHETIELPEPLIQDILPAGDYHLQEERRLFYVGMTRAKEALYLSCAYNYGGKTVRKISQFVSEALQLASPTPPAKVASAKELVERSRTQPQLVIQPSSKIRRMIRLDPHGVDDYLTCPLKYRYSHVLSIPVMRHHLVAYGSALHKAVEMFFRQRLQDQEMTSEELINTFEQAWSSEGFLTREHESLRMAQGRQTLQRFYAQQQEHPEYPTMIEEKFKFLLDDIQVVGRWDRVDRVDGRAVIIDYKSSEVQEQAQADRRTAESLQLLVYALSWHTLHGQLPDHVELRFLETGLVGSAQFTEEDLERAKTFLRQAAAGIRAGQFEAKPQEYSCRWCAFQAICPFAFRVR